MPKGRGFLESAEPPRFSTNNLFGPDLREMLLGIPSQMMDARHGGNRIENLVPTPRYTFCVTIYESLVENIR